MHSIPMPALVAIGFGLSFPLWLPIVIAAFVVGRKQFGMAALMSFLTLECVAIAVAVALANAI